MINFTTQTNYQGSNINKLTGLGKEFCTFNQAKAFFKLSGKELAGSKSCARLMRLIKKKEFNKKTKKEEVKLVPFHFNVFEKYHLLEVIKNNTSK